MKKCPYCAEEIQDKVVKCNHCGELLNVSTKSEKGKRWYKQWWAILLFVYLILSLLGGISILTGADKTPKKSSKNTKNPPKIELEVGDQVTTKQSFAVCKALFYLKEISKYAKQKDQEAVIKMINSKDCYSLPSYSNVIVEKVNYDGTVRIRIVGQRESMWTYYTYLQ